MLSRMIRPRTLLLLILLLAVAAMTYGFAATLTVGGDKDIAAGSSDVMTNMEADVTWVLNPTTPDENPVANVAFAPSHTPSEVHAVLLDSSQAPLASWVECTGTGPFVCTFIGGVEVEDVYYIRIAAAE
jgi:hypothetical protein